MPISLQAAPVLLQPSSFGGGKLPVSGGTAAESEIDEGPPWPTRQPDIGLKRNVPGALRARTGSATFLLLFLVVLLDDSRSGPARPGILSRLCLDDRCPERRILVRIAETSTGISSITRRNLDCRQRSPRESLVVPGSVSAESR